MASPNVTKEIFELKDHLVELERQNATLLVEIDNLRSNNQNVTEHCRKLDSQLSNLQSQNISLQNQYSSLQQHNAKLQSKDDVVEREREQLKKRTVLLNNVQADYRRLQEDHQRLRSAYDQLGKDYGDVVVTHRQAKMDYKSLQQKAAQLQNDLVDAKENVIVADLEFQKLESKMEAMYEINERIENENQSLLIQIKQLLNQNQELLTQALNSKDHFAEEEKSYLEKLAELHRQKMCLEEKIMEHYKNSLSPKKKGFGALIVQKARGIISRGPRHGKSKNNLAGIYDNSSQESGSTEVVNSGHHSSVDEIASLLSTTSSFLLGSKSVDDVNDSATKEKQAINENQTPAGQQPGVVGGLENYGDPKTTTLTKNGLLLAINNAAHCNDSDDSFTEEMMSYGNVQHHVTSGSLPHNNSGGSRSSSSRNKLSPDNQESQIQNLSNTEPHIVHDSPCMTASSSISHTETEMSITTQHPAVSGSQSDNFSSHEVLPSSVFMSVSTYRCKIPAENVVSCSHDVSSKLQGESLKCVQSVDGCLGGGHLVENQGRNSGQEAQACVNTSKISMSGNEQPSFVTNNVEFQTSTFPITNSLHQNGHEKHSLSHHPPPVVKRSRELKRTPTDLPRWHYTAKHPNHSSTSFSRKEESTSVNCARLTSVPSRDGRNACCNNRNYDREARNVACASLKNKNFQVRNENMLQGNPCQVRAPLPRSEHEILSDNESYNVSFSIVSGRTSRRTPQTNPETKHHNAHQRALPAGNMGHSSNIRRAHSRPPSEIPSKGYPRNEPLGCTVNREFSFGFSRHTKAEKNMNNCNNQYPERPKSVPPYSHSNYEYGDLTDFSVSPLNRAKNGIMIEAKEALDIMFSGRHSQPANHSYVSEHSMLFYQQQQHPQRQFLLYQKHHKDCTQAMVNRSIEIEQGRVSQIMPMMEEPHGLSYTINNSHHNLTTRRRSAGQVPTSRLDCEPFVHQEVAYATNNSHHHLTNPRPRSAGQFPTSRLDCEPFVQQEVPYAANSHNHLTNLRPHSAGQFSTSRLDYEPFVHQEVPYAANSHHHLTNPRPHSAVQFSASRLDCEPFVHPEVAYIGSMPQQMRTNQSPNFNKIISSQPSSMCHPHNSMENHGIYPKPDLQPDRQMLVKHCHAGDSGSEDSQSLRQPDRQMLVKHYHAGDRGSEDSQSLRQPDRQMLVKNCNAGDSRSENSQSFRQSDRQMLVKSYHAGDSGSEDSQYSRQSDRQMLVKSYHAGDSGSEDSESLRSEYFLGASPQYHGGHLIDTDKDARQFRESNTKHIPFLPASGNCSPSRQTGISKVHGNFVCSESPQCGQVKSPPQQNKSDGAHRTDLSLGGCTKQYNSHQPQLKSQGKPASSYHNSSAPTQQSRVITCKDHNTVGPVPSKSDTSPVLTREPAVVTEKETESEQSGNTNLIWYEYGCV